MKTREIRADQLTTRHRLVEQGPRRRHALNIAEVRVEELAVTVRVAGEPGPRGPFNRSDKVRVAA